MGRPARRTARAATSISEVGDAHQVGGRQVAPADHGAQSGQQLLEGERLDQVVVRAQVEASDAIGELVTRAENQDRRLRPARAQAAQDGQAVDLGEHDVEQDRVVRVGLGKGQPLFAVARGVDGVAGFAQPLGQRARQRLEVLDQKHPHASSMPRAAGCFRALIGFSCSRTMNGWCATPRFLSWRSRWRCPPSQW